MGAGGGEGRSLRGEETNDQRAEPSHGERNTSLLCDLQEAGSNERDAGRGQIRVVGGVELRKSSIERNRV